MSRLRSILLSSAATSVVVTTLLALQSLDAPKQDELIFTILVGILVYFVVCIVVITAVGLPLSLTLDHFGWTSRGAYIATGVVTSLLALSGWLMVDWCCRASNPFFPSLAERISLVGARQVTIDYLRLAAFLVVSSATAANFYWSAGRRRAV
jgi:hypothetical protein